MEQIVPFLAPSSAPVITQAGTALARYAARTATSAGYRYLNRYLASDRSTNWARPPPRRVRTDRSRPRMVTTMTRYRPRGRAGSTRRNVGRYRRRNKRVGTQVPRPNNWIDNSDGATSIITADTWTFLPAAESGSLFANVDQGSARDERLSDVIYIHHIDIQIRLTFNGNLTGGSDICEVYVILDTQCNGTTPSMEDVFADSTTANKTLRVRELDETSRFRILKKWNIALNSTGPWFNSSTLVTHYANHKYAAKFHRLRFPSPLKVQYARDNPTSSLSILKDNNIFMVCRCINGHSSIEWQTRTVFWA